MTVAWKQQRAVRLDDLTEAEIERESIELWEGEVVCKMSPAGKRHGRLADRILFLFQVFLQSTSGRECCGDNRGFRLSRDPDTLLSPDVALFSIRPETPGPWYEFCPEIAVEVKSPEDSAIAMRAKRDVYLRHGAEQVWIVDPEARTLAIHFADGRLMEAEGGTAACEGVADGLAVDLDALFAA